MQPVVQPQGPERAAQFHRAPGHSRDLIRIDVISKLGRDDEARQAGRLHPLEIRAAGDGRLAAAQDLRRQFPPHGPPDDRLLPAPRHDRQGEHVLQNAQVEIWMANVGVARRAVEIARLEQRLPVDVTERGVGDRPAGMGRGCVALTVPPLPALAAACEVAGQPFRKAFLLRCRRPRPYPPDAR